MKTIYFIVDEKGFKYTAMMYTNKKAANAALEGRAQSYPEKKFHIEIGYAFSY